MIKNVVPSFLKKRDTKLRLGLYLYQQQAFYAICDKDSELIKAERVDCESSDAKDMMEFLAKKEPLVKNCKASLTIGLGQYISKQIAQPDGNSGEWLPKIWASVSDVAEFPITQAVVDYYPMPQGRRHQDTMLSVVVLDQQRLRPWVDACHGMGVQIQGILTPDIAIRNMVERSMKGQKDCVACLYIQDADSILTIQKEGTIYLTRSIRHGASSDPGQFLLELRRSMDYFDGYYNESSISVIFLYSIDKISGNLKSVIEQDFSAVVVQEAGIDQAFMSHLAMGSVL